MIPEIHLRLYLVRHGEVAANREYRYVGNRDDRLTEQGQVEARSLGQLFAGTSGLRVLSSPRQRTLQTAQPIAEALGVAVEPEPRLREQSYGDWEGLSRDEVVALGAGHRDRLARFDRDPATAPPGGEAMTAVQERVIELVKELVAIGRATSDEATTGEGTARGTGAVILVSHVGPIKSILSAALDLSLERGRRLFLDPGTVSVVDWGEPPLVRLFNEHSHFGWGNARWMDPSRKK